MLKYSTYVTNSTCVYQWSALSGNASVDNVGKNSLGVTVSSFVVLWINAAIKWPMYCIL